MDFTALLFAGLTTLSLSVGQQESRIILSGNLQKLPAGGATSSLFQSIEESVVVEGTRSKFERARSLIRGLPVNEAMARLAEFFLGSPYLAMSLDQSGREQLHLDLTQFDCMLFVEQLLAIVSADSFDGFAEQTRRLRYRNGEISYCTRQHYFRDWVGSAQLQEVLESSPVRPRLAMRHV